MYIYVYIYIYIYIYIHIYIHIYMYILSSLSDISRLCIYVYGDLLEKKLLR